MRKIKKERDRSRYKDRQTAETEDTSKADFKILYIYPYVIIVNAQWKGRMPSSFPFKYMLANL